jgi:hypothetical protein
MLHGERETPHPGRSASTTSRGVTAWSLAASSNDGARLADR